jgi:hypothetical protein
VQVTFELKRFNENSRPYTAFDANIISDFSWEPTIAYLRFLQEFRRLFLADTIAFEAFRR